MIAFHTRNKNLIIFILILCAFSFFTFQNVNAQQSPFNGTYQIAPGKIEAENFDNGGQNISYFDKSSVDAGHTNMNRNVYRSGVHPYIEDNRRGGYNIGFLSATEWLEYTVDFKQRGVYKLEFDIARGFDTSTNSKGIKVSVGNDQNVAKAIVVRTGFGGSANNGDWFKFASISTGEFKVTKGKHVIRLYFEEGCNFDFMNFVRLRDLETPTPPKTPISFAVSNVTETSTVITWDDQGENGEVEIYRSQSQSSGFSLIKTLASHTLIFENTGLTDDTRYFYKVRLKKENLYSDYTTTIDVKTKQHPKPITGQVNQNGEITKDKLILYLDSHEASSVEGNVWKDKSGYNNHITDIDSRVKWENGHMVFPEAWMSGTVASSISIDAKPFSLGFWYKASNIYDWNMLLGAKSKWGAYMFSCDKNGEIYGGVDFAQDRNAIRIRNQIKKDTWVNVTYTYDGTYASVYVNGEFVGSKAFALTPKAWEGFRLFNIGGSLDVLYLYENRVLDAQEVKQNYAVHACRFVDGKTCDNIGETGKRIPLSPSNLITSLTSDYKVNLTWQDNSDNEEQFIIERKSGEQSSNNTFKALTTKTANVKTHIDQTVSERKAEDQYYTYRIAAKNKEGKSAYSSEVTVMIPKKETTDPPTDPNNPTNPDNNPDDNQSEIIQQGLILSYNVHRPGGFDKTTRILKDLSGHGHDLQLDQKSKIENDHLYIPNESVNYKIEGIDIKGADDYSVGFWMNANEFTDYNLSMGSQKGWGAFLFHASKAATTYVGTSGSQRISGNATKLKLQTWTYVVFTYDGKTAKLYYNGVLKASKNYAVDYEPWGGFRIRKWGGYLDALHIYKGKVLSKEDVQNNYTNTKCYFSETEKCPETIQKERNNEFLQLQALKDFYNSTGGDDWINNIGWKEGVKDPNLTLEKVKAERWYGVVFTEDKLTAIAFGSDNNLTGQIPESIGDLSDLTLLRLLRQQSLRSTFPKNISKLVNLKVLHFDYSGISGELPADLGNLVNLENLTLNRNSYKDANGELMKISGPLPESMRKMKKLGTLFIPGNSISGPIPEWLGELTELTSLDISYNDFEGEFPKSIKNLKKLRRFSSANNRRINATFINEFTELESLVSLNMGNHGLKGPIPSNIGDLKALENIYIVNCQLKSTLPESMGELSNLKGINLSGTRIYGQIPKSFLNLKNLGGLTLSSRNFLWGKINLPYNNYYQFRIGENFFLYRDVKEFLDNSGTSFDKAKERGLSYFNVGNYNNWKCTPISGNDPIYNNLTGIIINIPSSGKEVTIAHPDQGEGFTYTWYELISNCVTKEIEGANGPILTYKLPVNRKTRWILCAVQDLSSSEKLWVSRRYLVTSDEPVISNKTYYSVQDGELAEDIWSLTPGGSPEFLDPNQNHKLVIDGHDVIVNSQVITQDIDVKIVDGKGSLIIKDLGVLIVNGKVNISGENKRLENGLQVSAKGSIKIQKTE